MPVPSQDELSAIAHNATKLGGADQLESELHLARMRCKFTGAPLNPVAFRGWEVERRLGRGGMGAVFLARDCALNRPVALKLLGTPGDTDASRRDERMRREAQALAQIRHPNVVQVYRVDLEGGSPVIEMEFVEGITLRDWSKTSPSWRAVVEAYSEAGDGILAIHTVGLVHRDIKPDNILRTRDGCVKVVDLGLAAGERRDQAKPSNHTSVDLTHERLTQTNATVGTPGYIAPELFRGGPSDAAVDQFSLACALYEALVGTLPFDDQDPERVVAAIRRGELRGEHETSLPRWLLRVLKRALSLDPRARYATMSAFVAALRRGLAGRRRWWFGGGTVASLLTLTSVSGTLGWGLGQAPASRCDRLADALKQPWEADLLAQIEARAQSLGSPAASNSLKLLNDALARSVAIWTKSRLDLCREKDRGNESGSTITWPAQQECLDDVKGRIVAQLEALAAGPNDLLGGIVAASSEFDRMPECAKDPSTARSVRGGSRDGQRVLRDKLRQAARAETLGQYVEAEALATDAVADTARLPRLRALALYRLGHVLGTLDRGREASLVLYEARDTAYAAGSDALMCDVLVYQSKLQAAIFVDPEVSRRDLGLASACIERLGTSAPLVHADLAEARGLLAQANDHDAQAIPLHQQALELRRGHLGPEHYELSKSHHNLGNALGAGGRVSEAREQFDRAIEIRTRVVGSGHPAVGNVWFDMGRTHLSGGDLEAAQFALMRALKIYEESRAPLSARAQTHLVLARLALQRQSIPSALKHLQQTRTLQVRDPALKNDDLSLAVRYHTEGLLYARQRNFNSALESFERSSAVLRRHGPTNPQVHDSTLRELEMLYGLSAHERLTRRVAREQPWLGEHLRKLDAAERGRFAWYIADSAFRQHANAQAITFLRVAIDAYESLKDESSVSELKWLLARSLRASGDRSGEAEDLARQAQAQAQRDHDLELISEIRLWLERAPTTRAE